VPSNGKPGSGIARELGVSVELLDNWVHQKETDDGQRGGLTTNNQEKLRRLRRENRILREERELLKEPLFCGPFAGSGQISSVSQGAPRSGLYDRRKTLYLGDLGI
jgi:hypothetical protein